MTAIFSASAIHEWYLPGVPMAAMVCGIVLLFTAVNLCGVHWAGRLAVPIATASAAPDLACGRILINRCGLAGECGLSIDREPWVE